MGLGYGAYYGTIAKGVDWMDKSLVHGDHVYARMHYAWPKRWDLRTGHACPSGSVGVAGRKMCACDWGWVKALGFGWQVFSLVVG